MKQLRKMMAVGAAILTSAFAVSVNAASLSYDVGILNYTIMDNKIVMHTNRTAHSNGKVPSGCGFSLAQRGKYYFDLNDTVIAKSWATSVADGMLYNKPVKVTVDDAAACSGTYGVKINGLSYDRTADAKGHVAVSIKRRDAYKMNLTGKHVYANEFGYPIDITFIHPNAWIRISKNANMSPVAATVWVRGANNGTKNDTGKMTVPAGYYYQVSSNVAGIMYR